MLSLALDNPSTYRRMLAIYGGNMGEAFGIAVQKILRRYFAQNNSPVPGDSALMIYARALWELARRRGLPAPLKGPDQGESAELSSAEVEALSAPLVAAFPLAEARALLAPASRDLVRALFQPEFKKCRLSYKECSPGRTACERQDLATAVARISGAHCVDCPYWAQIDSEKNEKLFFKEWDPARTADLRQNLAVFLPEDFRSLRQLLHLHTRFGGSG